MNPQTTALAQQMAKDMAKELAKQMLAQAAHLSPTLSPEQSRARQNTVQIAAAWQAAGASTQNSWLALAQLINLREGRFGNKALNGYRTFFLINSTRLISNMGILTAAPADMTPPAGLPPMMLTAALPAAAADGDAPGVTAFTLTLASPGLPGLFQIWATKPTLADKVLRPAHDFALLGTQGGLYPQADITALYLTKFDPPTPGAKVAIQVVAVSSDGFKGTPLLLTAVAQAATVARPAKGDKDLLKAA